MRRGMICYEWKKIWQNRLTQLMMLGISLFFVFCIISNVSQTEGLLEDGSRTYGMSGIQARKEQNETVVLTQEETDRIVREYLAYTTDSATNSDNPGYLYLSEKMYRSYYLPRKELLGMIEGIYSPAGSEASMKEVFEENLGRDIFQARLDRDNNRIDLYVKRGMITDKQAEYWKEQVKKIQDPLTVGYYDGWKQIYYAGNWAVIIMMIVVIGVAPVFAGEYQSKFDSLLLCMKHGKNRLVFSKVVAAWLFTTLVYVLLTGGYSAAYLLLYGTEGGDLPIQLVAGYVFTVCLMAATLLLSSFMKNSYSVIVIILPLVLVIALLSPDQGGYVWSHFLSLVPSQIVNFAFESLTAYEIFGCVLNWLSAGILIDGMLAVILTYISTILFRRHQVNK